MNLIKFVTVVDTPIYINPDQVLTVRPYEGHDEANITQIQTSSVFITVKEPINEVVNKLTAQPHQGIEIRMSKGPELCIGGEFCLTEPVSAGPSEITQSPCLQLRKA